MIHLKIYDLTIEFWVDTKALIWCNKITSGFALEVMLYLGTSPAAAGSDNPF